MLHLIPLSLSFLFLPPLRLQTRQIPRAWQTNLTTFGDEQICSLSMIQGIERKGDATSRVRRHMAHITVLLQRGNQLKLCHVGVS